MTKLRYHKTFKQGMAAVLFSILLFTSVVIFFIVFKIQYDRLVSNMKPLDATIVDINFDLHLKGPDEQEIYIEYKVDGMVYRRELKTDTTISFAAGTGANYSIGDQIQIFYDPQNPEIIAVPRSLGVGYVGLAFGLIFSAFGWFGFIVILKNRNKFLVTQEEYDKERKALRKSKLKKNNKRTTLK